eukprot:GEMP01029865.1.p1 GENE.GEMP01029865.1~~GEMP01029865.1.p1  ORF type:complete len:515 (+),score=98.77 GEMP01029865.1:84-1628(+)
MSRVQGRYLNGDSVLVGTCKTIGSTLVAIAILHHRFASAIVLLCPTTTKNLTDFHTETPPPIVSIIIKSEEENELPSEDDFRITLRLHAEHEDTATCVRALKMLRHADFAVPLVTEVLLHAARDDEPEAHREILCTLVRAGADATGALLEAASDGAGQNAVGSLLSASVSPDIADRNGDTALIVAARHGCKGVVEALLSAGANIDHANTNGIMARGETALMIACREGQTDVVETLLSARANVDLSNNHNSQALSLACVWSRVDVVKVLLSAGVKNIDFPDIWGCSPLFFSAVEGRKEVVELLLRAGVNVNHGSSYPYLPMIVGSTEGWLANGCVTDEAVLMFPSHTNDENTKNGYTALHGAARRGHHEVVGVLLSARAHVNQATDNGDTALLMASRHADKNSVNALLSAGACVNHANTDGETVLLVACRLSDKNLVNALLSAVACVNHPNADGETALLIASRGRNKNLLEALISAQSCVNHANMDAETALSIASRRGNADLLETSTYAGATWLS